MTNRPIKFRAYCKKHERWEFYTLGDLVCGSTSSDNGEGGEFANWSEFTGLTDKNGVEIYEGDICRVHDFEVEEVEIRWYPETAGFAGYNKLVENTFQNPWIGISPNHFEIIGNVYENEG